MSDRKARKHCGCDFPPARVGYIWRCDCGLFFQFLGRSGAGWRPVYWRRAHWLLRRSLKGDIRIQMRAGFRTAFSLRHIKDFSCSNERCSVTHRIH